MTVLQAIWDECRRPCIVLLSDAVFFAACVALLAMFSFGIERLPLLDHQKDTLEQLHSLAILASLSVFVTQTCIYILILVLGRLKHAHATS